MPGVDLSSLNSPEMRRLLAAAEARHNHVLAEQLRGELARRGARVRALPREPTTFVTGSFDEVWGLEPAAEAETGPKAAPRRRVAAAILGAVGAAAVAIVVGWQLARSGAETPTPPQAVMAAQVPVPPAPLPAPMAAPMAAPAAAAVAAQVAAERPAPKKAVAKPKAAARPVPAKADRAAQDRRILRAYEGALAAGVDPLVLDHDQARFRIALSRTTNRGRLDQLYAERIRELEAAARRRR